MASTDHVSLRKDFAWSASGWHYDDNGPLTAQYVFVLRLPTEKKRSPNKPKKRDGIANMAIDSATDLIVYLNVLISDLHYEQCHALLCNC